MIDSKNVPAMNERNVADLLSFPLTELGNAQRFVALYGDHIRYLCSRKKWMYWDGRRWALDNQGVIEQLAARMTEVLSQRANEVPDQNSRDALVRHARKSQSAAGITALVKLSKTEPGIPIQEADLDQDPHLLTCENGTVDLRRGELLEHSPSHYITRLAPVKFNEAARCPTFMGFLRQIMNEDVGLINFLQRAIGYGMTGCVNEKCLFLFVGDGNNGKTTLLEVFKFILGEYAGQVPVETLMMKSSDGIGNDIAQLKGLRFVTASEIDQGKKLAEAKVKQLTGMGTLQARFLYGELFEFTPTFKIFMDTNHRPEVRGVDTAIWKRLKLVPFAVEIPENCQDKNLGQKLRDEADGIFLWAVLGAKLWYRIGLRTPHVIDKAVAKYREEMDIVKDFIEDRCELDGKLRCPTGTLYSAFEDWCRTNRTETLSAAAFGKRLGKVGGLTQAKVGAARGWKGIGLRSTVDPNSPSLESDAIENTQAAS